MGIRTRSSEWKGKKNPREENDQMTRVCVIPAANRSSARHWSFLGDKLCHRADKERVQVSPLLACQDANHARKHCDDGRRSFYAGSIIRVGMCMRRDRAHKGMGCGECGGKRTGVTVRAEGGRLRNSETNR